MENSAYNRRFCYSTKRRKRGARPRRLVVVWPRLSLAHGRPADWGCCCLGAPCRRASAARRSFGPSRLGLRRVASAVARPRPLFAVQPKSDNYTTAVWRRWLSPLCVRSEAHYGLPPFGSHGLSANSLTSFGDRPPTLKNAVYGFSVSGFSVWSC